MAYGTQYETVAASATGQEIGPGSTGKSNDHMEGVLIVPATTSPGNVLLLDGATSITIFAGGAASVTTLIPFFVPFPANAVGSTGWKITTGANVSAIAFGRFS